MLHRAGYRALRWERCLLSHAWRVTFAPLIPLLLWPIPAGQDITAPKTRHIQFKRHQAPLLGMNEVQLWEAFVSPAHFLLAQAKSAALPAQLGALALAMVHMCLAFAVLERTGPKQTRCSVSRARNERIRLLAV